MIKVQEDIHPSTLQNSTRSRWFTRTNGYLYHDVKSMQQAHYDDTNLGHFGCQQNIIHFTSPIRRYPDLTVPSHS